MTSNLVVSAVSQTNLAAANILRGKTITIKNGNGNIWSVAGNTSGLKYVTGTVNAGGNTKFLAKDNSGNGSYQYYGTANPGMTPVFCFSYSTNYEATICWRYASNTADWIEMPHLQSSYSSQISGWSWASNAVDIPVRDINTDNVGAISYIIFGY